MTETTEHEADRTPIGTLGLSLVITLPLLYSLLRGDLGVIDVEIERGAMSSWLLSRGEWFRILSTAMIHDNTRHALGNLGCLAGLGAFLETKGGRSPGWLLATFVLGTLVGNGWAVAAEPHTITIGASAGVFALAGAMLVPFWGMGLLIRAFVCLLIVGFFLLEVVFADKFYTGVAEHAHIGGFAVGIVMSLIPKGSLGERCAVVVSAGFLVAGVLWAGLVLPGYDAAAALRADRSLFLEGAPEYQRGQWLVLALRDGPVYSDDFYREGRLVVEKLAVLDPSLFSEAALQLKSQPRLRTWP